MTFQEKIMIQENITGFRNYRMVIIDLNMFIPSLYNTIHNPFAFIVFLLLSK